ncbi:LegC family aminotransferase [Exiguobacterium undae]
MNKEWLEIIKGIKNIHDSKEFLPLHEPIFDEKEVEYVTDCIQTGWVSSVGKYVEDFEKLLAEYTGVKRAVAVVNGTAALQIALKIANVKKNDEIFVPSLTFIATANAISYLQAVPHFVDVSKETLGLDPNKLENHIRETCRTHNNCLINKKTGRVVRAVVAMHTFGHSVDLDKLLDICNRYNLVLIEDAAESLGSYYKGQHTGSFGLVSALSFNGNKIITTGGGGAILTNNEELADYAKHITTTAKIPHQWEYDHDEIGYNYRMPNINAAIGCAQIEKLDEFLISKRDLVKQYQKIFSSIDGVTLFTEPNFGKSNYWLQAIIIDIDKHDHGTILNLLNKEGIMARPIWRPLHELEPYKNCPKSDLEVTNYLKKAVINIPSTPLKGRVNR